MLQGYLWKGAESTKPDLCNDEIYLKRSLDNNKNKYSKSGLLRARHQGYQFFPFFLQFQTDHLCTARKFQEQKFQDRKSHERKIAWMENFKTENSTIENFMNENSMKVFSITWKFHGWKISWESIARKKMAGNFEFQDWKFQVWNFQESKLGDVIVPEANGTS